MSLSQREVFDFYQVPGSIIIIGSGRLIKAGFDSIWRDINGAQHLLSASVSWDWEAHLHSLIWSARTGSTMHKGKRKKNWTMCMMALALHHNRCWMQILQCPSGSSPATFQHAILAMSNVYVGNHREAHGVWISTMNFHSLTDQQRGERW